MNTLYEGLRENDLEDLVLPILSIDEYESKINDDGIVIGFYTHYRDPANDLNRFIQKSAIDILDSEVSPAPTEDGYYVVFVEMERNSQFPENLMQLLNTLTNLVGFDKWQFKTIDQKGIYDASKDQLAELLKLEQNEDSNTEESIKEFLKFSLLDNVLIEGDQITFIKNNAIRSYRIVDYNTYIRLHEHYIKLNEGVQLTSTALHNVRSIEKFLGPHWLIEHFKNTMILSHEDSCYGLVLDIQS